MHSMTFESLKCISLQVKVVLKYCTSLQVESKKIYSSKVTKKNLLRYIPALHGSAR